MRKSSIVAVSAFTALIASPALAVGLGDLAKVVLNNGSILTKGQQKCGSALGLSPLEQLAVSAARSKAKSALPLSEFLSLDQASDSAAEVATQSPTFCADTKAKKKGLLGKIASAAKGLAGRKIGI